MNELEAIRRFNRVYTPRVGLLDDSFLGTGLPLAAARLLFEVGPNGATVRDLRRRLGLDSGYLSRLLRGLEERRLVTVTADSDDRRRRLCHLTATGGRRWVQLDRRSDEIAMELLAPLTASQRRRLSEALATAALLIRSSEVTFHTTDPAGADATTAMTKYFDELDARFPGGFDRTGALGDGAASMGAPHGVFVVATASDGTIVGCGGVQRCGETAAEVKRMWIDADWRGAGIGRRLLGELEQFAATAGYSEVVLDTNATLTEAIAMYESAGYRPTERYNDNPYAERWFVKALVPSSVS